MAARHRESEKLRIAQEAADERYERETGILNEKISQQEYAASIITREIDYLTSQNKLLNEEISNHMYEARTRLVSQHTFFGCLSLSIAGSLD